MHMAQVFPGPEACIRRLRDHRSRAPDANVRNQSTKMIVFKILALLKWTYIRNAITHR